MSRGLALSFCCQQLPFHSCGKVKSNRSRAARGNCISSHRYNFTRICSKIKRGHTVNCQAQYDSRPQKHVSQFGAGNLFGSSNNEALEPRNPTERHSGEVPGLTFYPDPLLLGAWPIALGLFAWLVAPESQAAVFGSDEFSSATSSSDAVCERHFPFPGSSSALPFSRPLPLLAFPFSLPGLDFFSSFSTPDDEVTPSKGTCPTCIGVIDDTLGSCGSTANCLSSFDDRPDHFVAPWEYPTPVDAAMDALVAKVVSQGGVVQESNGRYLHASFQDREGGPTDDVEFLFSDPAKDSTVTIRSASRSVSRPDRGRNAKRLETIRAELRWEQVPILRNRQRLFVVIESPWDLFGPEPPPSYDYSKGIDFVPDGE